MAWAAAERNESDIMVISEPNRRRCETRNWLVDRNCDVAVVFLSRHIQVKVLKIG